MLVGEEYKKAEKEKNYVQACQILQKASDDKSFDYLLESASEKDILISRGAVGSIFREHFKCLK